MFVIASLKAADMMCFHWKEISKEFSLKAADMVCFTWKEIRKGFLKMDVDVRMAWRVRLVLLVWSNTDVERKVSPMHAL